MPNFDAVLTAIKYLHAQGVDVSSYLARLDNAIKTEAMFLRQLWNYALTLYRTGSQTAFLDDMIYAIRTQLTKAWNEGADAVGVSRDEMDSNDMAVLEGIINSEYDQVISLADAILTARGQMDELAFRD
jgi:hypothetical protein